MVFLVASILFSILAYANGSMARTEVQADAEVAGSYPAWMSVGYDGHVAHLAAQAQAQAHEAAVRKSHEFVNAKALADQHAAIAAWKVKAAAEEESRALAFQAAAEAKAVADQEADHASWKAKAAAEEESKALSVAQEADFAGKEANLASLAAQNAADQLNKSSLEAQARAEEEANAAAEKAKLAEKGRQAVALASQAKMAAEEAAAQATQKLHIAEEEFWKAKHAKWSW